MALVLKDRVKETTTTAGTGTVTLLGASAGFQSFAVIGDANTTYYTIAAQTGTEWEVGIGTYTLSGTTLARTTVLSNSSGTQPSALSFSAGTKDVFVTYPSSKSVNLDASGNATALGTPAAFVGTNITGTASGLTAGNVTTNANLTGDVTSVGNATTLATVNSNVGSFTLASITVNAKGLITAASSGSASIPSGTIMLFVQTAAPTGWTKSTTHDNKALRVVSGTVGSGGTVAFTTAFASQGVSGSIANQTATNISVTATNQAATATNISVTATNQAATATNQSATAGGTVNGTTLSTSQIPSHLHSFGIVIGSTGGQFGLLDTGNSGSSGTPNTSNTGGGGSHDHSFSGTSHNHTQNSHNHTQDAHNHTQNSHNHTQDAHNHTQNAHNHTFTGTAINLAVQYVDVIIATKN